MVFSDPKLCAANYLEFEKSITIFIGFLENVLHLCQDDVVPGSEHPIELEGDDIGYHGQVSA